MTCYIGLLARIDWALLIFLKNMFINVCGCVCVCVCSFVHEYMYACAHLMCVCGHTCHCTCVVLEDNLWKHFSVFTLTWVIRIGLKLSDLPGKNLYPQSRISRPLRCNACLILFLIQGFSLTCSGIKAEVVFYIFLLVLYSVLSTVDSV